MRKFLFITSFLSLVSLRLLRAQDVSNWLLSPNGGEVYSISSSNAAIAIDVDRTIYSPSSISAELYRGSVKVAGPTIVQSTSVTYLTYNYGSPEGDNFKVKIYDTANPTVADWSNDFFYIAKAVPQNISNWVQVNSTVFYEGGNMNISFTQTNLSANFIVELYQTDALGQDNLISQLYNGAYVRTLTVPVTWNTFGNNFRLKAHLTNNVVFSDWSDYFALLPDLTNWLLHPQNQTDVYKIGDNIPVSINTTIHNPSQIGVELYKSNTRVAGPFIMSPSGGTVSATKIEYGSDFILKVYDASDANWQDQSNANFKINPNPSDWLIKPNGGERYAVGDNIPIVINGSSDIITAELYKNDVLVYGPVSGSSNSLTIPTASLSTGNDYKLKITGSNGNEDISNFTFTIFNIQSWIISPNGSEVYYRQDGDVINVAIDNSVFPLGTYVKIDLYEGDFVVDSKNVTTPGNVTFNGSYTADINYKVKITDNNNTALFDWSDNAFSILDIPSNLSSWIVYPNGGELITKGQTITVNVNKQLFNPRSVKVSLLNGDNQVMSKTGTVDNSISFNTSLLQIGNYNVKIEDENYTAYDMSDQVFSILPDLTNWILDVKSGDKFVPGATIIGHYNTDIYSPSSTALQLYKGDVPVTLNSTPYFGAGNFIIDTYGLLPGDDYKIKISDNTFPSLVIWINNIILVDLSEWLLTPNGGESYDQFDPIKVKFDLSVYDPSSLNSTIDIEVYDHDHLWYYAQYPFVNGEAIAQNILPVSDKLKIRVIVNGGGGFIADISDNYFTCRKIPDLGSWVLTPKSGDSYKNGETLSIDLDESFYDSHNINVTLFAQGIRTTTYENVIKNEETGLFEVTLDGVPLSQHMQVLVTANENTTVKGNSACCFAVLPVHLNTVTSTSFDSDGTPYASTKTHYNEIGQMVQTLSRSFSKNFVVVNQPLRDLQDRAIGNFLPALIQGSNLEYIYNLVPSLSGNPYSYQNFDLNNINSPEAVDNSRSNTVGWYYSDSNTLEPFTPHTKYPYSRIEYYTDGSGEAKKLSVPGDFHYLGSGHEIMSRTFAVGEELNDYLNVRRNQVGLADNLTDSNTGDVINSLASNAIQSVTRDQNGRYAVSISDKSGRVVMTARGGISNDVDLAVNNQLMVSAALSETTGAPFSPWIYFYILQPTAVTVTQSFAPSEVGYTVEDVASSVSKSSGTFAGSDGKWPAGIYRIKNDDYRFETTVTVSFTNHYKDVAYSFYDDAGRLKTSISPNGFKQLKSGIAYDKIDKTTYEYNFQGRLLATTEPDAGRTEYLYRKDGSIRYSQNAQQRLNATQTPSDLTKGKFSYTNYDAIGRPVESGEYIGNDWAFTALKTKMEFSDQLNFDNSQKKDWVKTYYDVPDDNFYLTTKLNATDYTQDFLRGAVSHSENINIRTWYSYDELGRVVWMAQLPTQPNFPRVFVVKYSYDFLGNVLTVANLAFDAANGNLTEQFYHHYEYDADKRLSKAFTSRDGTNKMLRATYEYYLHGPLKRIELGDKLQGIDFVYNINGWLTQINHPDGGAADPGADGLQNSAHQNVRKDVFGMVIDYYESDLTNVFASSPSSVHDPSKRHRLPMDNVQPQLANHQPLIRFSIDEKATEPFFKKFGAQNSQYSHMISQLKGQAATN